MNTPEFILQALFFVVNSFALCFLVWFVIWAVKRMEKKLDATISFMRWVKSRHDTTHLYTLCKLQGILIKEERYEEAAKIKEIIEKEMEDLNEKAK